MKIKIRANKNQAGFAALEAVLILIIVAMLGAVGWYVWNTNKNIDTVLTSTEAVNNSSLPKASPIKTYDECLNSKASATDKSAFPNTCTTIAGKKFTDPNPNADWKKYVSKTGRYSLKHPPKWYQDVCDESAADLTLYLGTNKNSRVICNSEHISQIFFVSTSAVPTESEQRLGDEYSSKTSKKVKVDGVTGERTSGELKHEEFGIPAGTLIVRYFFLAPERSYIASYVQTPGGDYKANNLKYFDLMIQKTLSFQ